MNKTLAVVLVLWAVKMQAQSPDNPSPLTLSMYVETYYLYDFGKPADNTRPAFVYSHNRHHEFNANLGYLKAAFQKEQIRANLALAAGTYMNANYAAEPGVLKHIYEANTGLRLSKKRNLWVDAGIFPSHIGFESATGKDCWTLTRSIMADNSPYFESGAKISFTSPNEKWFASGLLLNGWQRIQRLPGNSLPAFGHQLSWKPNGKIALNSSSFVGSEQADSLRRMRYFHNFYGIFQLNDALGITAGFDIGAEQQSYKSREKNIWYTPVLIARIKTSAKSFLALRGEYYHDPHGVIIQSGTPEGFQVLSYSINFDCFLGNYAVWRVEARGFSGKDPIFLSAGSPARTNFFLATSLAVWW